MGSVASTSVASASGTYRDAGFAAGGFQPASWTLVLAFTSTIGIELGTIILSRTGNETEKNYGYGSRNRSVTRSASHC